MGHEDVIRFLVQREAKVNEGRCELCKFRTPLQTATKEGYESIVRFLIENGANINAREWCRDTVLHIAMSGGNESIIRLLIENGADVNVVNLRHDTVLHIVTTEGNESLIRLLIENGADVNAYSMLRIATVKGIRSIVQLLVEKGADITMGEYGNLLDLASCYGHESIVQFLTKTLESRRKSIVPSVPNVADQIPATELDSKDRPNSDNGDAVTQRPRNVNALPIRRMMNNTCHPDSVVFMFACHRARSFVCTGRFACRLMIVMAGGVMLTGWIEIFIFWD